MNLSTNNQSAQSELDEIKRVCLELGRAYAGKDYSRQALFRACGLLGELADSIALGQAPAPSGEAPEGWVSVADQLPAAGSMVLAAVEFDTPGDWRMKVACYEPAAGELRTTQGWRIFGGSWIPSHWMPLPAAPKGASK